MRIKDTFSWAMVIVYAWSILYATNQTHVCIDLEPSWSRLNSTPWCCIIHQRWLTTLIQHVLKDEDDDEPVSWVAMYDYVDGVLVDDPL